MRVHSTWILMKLLSSAKKLVSAVTLLICVGSLTATIANAVEVSRHNKDPRIVRRAAVRSNVVGLESSDKVVKHDHPDAAVRGVDREQSWIVEAESPIACDTHPEFIAAATCGDAWCCGTTRFWGQAEYLYWQMRGSEIPPLVTTSSAGTTRDEAGVLGLATTTVLLGNNRFNDDGQSGGRFSFGYWLDGHRNIGIEFIYTTIGDQTESSSVSSDQVAILARPFFNAETLAEDARVLGLPNQVSGGVLVTGSTKYDVYEVLIRRPLSRDCITPTYIVYGYRSAELDDSLLIADSSRSLSGATAGATIQSLDSFRSRNVFHGFEAGFITDFRCFQYWQVNLAGKIAFGETNHTTTISGQSISTNSQGNATTNAGGLLTQQSNIGTFESNSHGVLQDFSVRLHRHIRKGITGSLGYSIHHWTDVARAGEQIDRTVNPTQIPPGTLVGEARPQHRDVTSGFVAQGITLGLECTW